MEAPCVSSDTQRQRRNRAPSSEVRKARPVGSLRHESASRGVDALYEHGPSKGGNVSEQYRWFVGIDWATEIRSCTVGSTSQSSVSTVKPSRISAPASTAASRSSLSRTVRRGQNPPRPPLVSSRHPSERMGRRRRSCDAQQGDSRSPLIDPVGPSDPGSPPCGQTMCVDVVSPGKLALSTSRTRYPLRARSIAVGAPAHRAPTMIGSYIRLFTPRSYRRLSRLETQSSPGRR